MQHKLTVSNTLETYKSAKLSWKRISCEGFLANTIVNVNVAALLDIVLPNLLILSFYVLSATIVSVNISLLSNDKLY